MAKNLEHLVHHVQYPGDKKSIVAACSGMMDVPNEDRTWFTTTLPEGKYANAEDVMKAILRKV